jgi:hypothetical protein
MKKLIKPKVVKEDLSCDMLKVMDFNHKSYEIFSQDLLKYIKEVLDSTLVQYRANKRMDKLQILQSIIQDYLTRICIEKYSLNMEFINSEMKLDPTLKNKIEKITNQSNEKYIKPNDQNNGQIRFGK